MLLLGLQGSTKELRLPVQLIGTIDEDVAVALQHAAREAGVKITNGAVKSQIRRATGGGKITDETLRTVAAAVPQGRANAATSAGIAKQANLDGSVARHSDPKLTIDLAP